MTNAVSTSPSSSASLPSSFPGNSNSKLALRTDNSREEIWLPVTHWAKGGAVGGFWTDSGRSSTARRYSGRVSSGRIGWESCKNKDGSNGSKFGTDPNGNPRTFPMLFRARNATQLGQLNLGEMVWIWKGFSYQKEVGSHQCGHWVAGQAEHQLGAAIRALAGGKSGRQPGLHEHTAELDTEVEMVEKDVLE